ncbi:MAG: hypothetical protein RhofKO_25840 [Rhodothermales bacterium]
MELLAKAAILTGDGGQLPPEDAGEFIDLSIAQNEILQQLRTETGIATSFYLDSIALGEPVLQAAVESDLATNGFTDTTKPALARKPLQPLDMIAAFDVTYSMLRKNIERDRLNETLNMLFAKRIGKDTVMIAFSGDTATAGTSRTAKALKQLDGFIKQAESSAAVHDVTIPANPTYSGDGGVLANMIDALPDDYAQDPDELGFFCSWGVARKYLREIEARATAIGDRAITDGAKFPYEGIRLYPVYKMSTDRIILTPKENLAIGWGYNLSVESQRQPRKQLIETTMTLAMDAKIAVDDAVVLGATA